MQYSRNEHTISINSNKNKIKLEKILKIVIGKNAASINMSWDYYEFYIN